MKRALLFLVFAAGVCAQTIGGTISGGTIVGQEASDSFDVNLTGSTRTYNVGATNVGDLSSAVTLTVTNNTGGDFSWVAYYMPLGSAMQTWDKDTIWYNTAAAPPGYPCSGGQCSGYIFNGAVRWNGSVYTSTIQNNQGNEPPANWTLQAVADGWNTTIQMDGDAVARTHGDGCGPSNTSGGSYVPTLWTFTAGTTCTMKVFLRPARAGASTGKVYLMDHDGVAMSTITLNGTGTDQALTYTATLPTGITDPLTDTVLDTHYTAPTACKGGTSYATQATLQAALNGASCGDVICVTAGSTITSAGTTITLPNIGDCTGNYTHLITSDYAGLPAAGTRVGPGDVAHLATIQSSGAVSILKTAAGANWWRVTGLEFSSSAGNLTQSAFETTLDSHHIIFDRNYVHMVTLDINPGTGNRDYSCFAANVSGANIGVVDNYLSVDAVQEVQAVTGLGPGPYKIVNNLIEAPGEGYLMGGSDGGVAWTNRIDIELRNNLVTKKLSWIPQCTVPLCGVAYDGISRTIKNCGEWKKAERVLMIGNIHEHNIGGAGQDGTCILWETTNQAGGGIWAKVSNLTFMYNVVRESLNAMSIVAGSYSYPSATSTNIVVKNNLFHSLGGAMWSVAGTACPAAGSGGTLFPSLSNNGGGSYGVGKTTKTPSGYYQSQHDPGYSFNWVFEHNTFMENPNCVGSIAYTSKTASTVHPLVKGVRMRYNLLYHGTYGFAHDGTSGTRQNLTTGWFDHWNPLTLAGNVIVAPGAYTVEYPAGDPHNWLVAATIGDVGFANEGNKDYRLCTAAGVPDASCAGASTYHNHASCEGIDCGADVTTINTITACVPIGVNCNPHP